MKEDSATLKVLKLDFGRFSVDKILGFLNGVALPYWATEVVEFLEQFVKGEKISCLTSGTTGPPKTIFFDAEQLNRSASITLDFFQLNQGDTVLLPLSCKHIAGKMMVVRALVGKLNLSVIEPVAKVREIVDAHYDFAVMVPLQVNSLLELKDQTSPSQFGKILLGGAEVSHHLVHKIKGAELNVWQSFGMTETMSHFAMRQISPVEQKNYFCLTGFTIDNKFNSQLEVSNPALGINELQTNDVIEIHSNGTFNWMGRVDNVVNSGGYKLHPELIELKIKGLLDTTPVFILVGIPDDKFGEKLVLFYEGDVFVNDHDLTILKTELKTYEWPREFISTKVLDRTNSGKIIRKDYTGH